MGRYCRLAIAVALEVLQRIADKTLFDVSRQRTPRYSGNESKLRQLQAHHVNSQMAV